MSVTIEDLQQYVEKPVIVHLITDEGTLDEVHGEIKAATVAGVAFKKKGTSGLQLLDVSKIEEVASAPVKAKPVTQKKIAPIEMGQARQHLLDRHGVELAWAKEADEKSAFEWHASLDHSNLGHIHVAKDEKPKDEREKALAENAG